MKKFSIIVFVFAFISITTSARIRNGYQRDIHKVREDIALYNLMLKTDNTSGLEKRRIKVAINRLMAIESYHASTEQLIKQFHLISPALYNRVDSIKDAKGRAIDIYIKFVPHDETLIMAGGITFMARAIDDPDACVSEYGKHTVSIKIWISNRALVVLSHELGHVHYQVPNLARYTEYYYQKYQSWTTGSSHLGHAGNDRSGRSASLFEREFKRDFINHIRFRNNAPSRSRSALFVDVRSNGEIRSSAY
jgi:hypothetical protein